MTYTYVELAVKLKAAGYDHAFNQDDDHERPTLDMHGIGLIVEGDS